MANWEMGAIPRGKQRERLLNFLGERSEFGKLIKEIAVYSPREVERMSKELEYNSLLDVVKILRDSNNLLKQRVAFLEEVLKKNNLLDL